MIKLTYTFICSKCKKEEKQEWGTEIGWVIPKPSLPREWISFGFWLFCGKCRGPIDRVIKKMIKKGVK